MTIKKLQIEYDELAQNINFYEVASDGKLDFVIKVPVSLYREKEPDEAERVMGETVFTFFDRWANTKMGLRNYVVEAHQSIELRRKKTGTLAEDGNAEAQYELAIDCFTLGVRNRSSTQVEEAESWLKKAVVNGSKDAAEYFEKHWERDKASALRGIGT